MLSSITSAETVRRKPVIAILTVADDVRVFRGNKPNFVDLIRIGDELGAEVYVITTEDLKLTGERLLAHWYDLKAKKWTRKVVSAPNVIYNRVPYRKLEMLPDVQQTIQSCLKSRSVHMFNPSFFNKWSLFEWLNQSSDTRTFIPSTLQVDDVRQLERLLTEHDFVYLKPIRGKAGKGIMRVERVLKQGRPSYVLRIQSTTESQNVTFSSLSELWPQLQEEMGVKEYIAQQGIRLARFNKRPFDLRVLVQKTGKGRWAVSGVGARVAGKASITTHVPRGGSINDPERVLTSVFGAAEAARILERVKNAALLIASRLEKSSGHMYGEMSMDLGVDTSGRIWFFEANSKPMKFDEPDIRRKSLERIIRYSIFLAKKSRRR